MSHLPEPISCLFFRTLIKLGLLRTRIPIPLLPARVTSFGSSTSLWICGSTFPPTIWPTVPIVAVLSSKTYKTFAEVSANWDVGEQIRTMLMQYDDTPAPYFGTPDSNLLPFNTNAFTVHDQKRFYLNRGMIINDSAVPTPGATGAGHMPTVVKKVRLNIKCKGKVLKFASPEEPLPTNFGPFLWIGFAYTNNAAATTAGVPFMYGRTVTRFEDCG